MTIIYVDVSHHDWDRRGGQLDWAKIKAATSGVMCARATYGDPSGYHPYTRHFADFQQGARDAGYTVRGGYHNLIHGDAASMRRQVTWFRQQLDAQECHWAMVDVERYAELVDNGLWPRWDDCLRWQDAWYAVEDRPMAWYLPGWLVNSYYGSADLRRLRGPMIQSHYAGGDGTAQQIYAAAGGDTGTGWNDRYGDRTCDIWQYSSGANVPGASSQTDVNAYRGTLAALTALLTGSGNPLKEEEDMAKGAFYQIVKGGPGYDGKVWYLPNGGTGRVHVPDLATLGLMRTIAGTDEIVQVPSAAVLDLAAPLPPAAVPADLAPRLDAILAAANDDGNVTVQLDAAALAEVTAIRDAVAAVPSQTAVALGAKLAA